jgi:hypothetical protein
VGPVHHGHAPAYFPTPRSVSLDDKPGNPNVGACGHPAAHHHSSLHPRRSSIFATGVHLREGHPSSVPAPIPARRQFRPLSIPKSVAIRESVHLRRAPTPAPNFGPLSLAMDSFLAECPSSAHPNAGAKFAQAGHAPAPPGASKFASPQHRRQFRPLSTPRSVRLRSRRQIRPAGTPGRASIFATASSFRPGGPIAGAPAPPREWRHRQHVNADVPEHS